MRTRCLTSTTRVDTTRKLSAHGAQGGTRPRRGAPPHDRAHRHARYVIRTRIQRGRCCPRTHITGAGYSLGHASPCLRAGDSPRCGVRLWPGESSPKSASACLRSEVLSGEICARSEGASWKLEGRGGAEAVQRCAGRAGVHRVPVVTTAGPRENGTYMDGWSVRAAHVADAGAHLVSLTINEHVFLEHVLESVRVRVRVRVKG